MNVAGSLPLPQALLENFAGELVVSAPSASSSSFGSILEQELYDQKIHYDHDQDKSIICYLLGLIFNLFTTDLHQKYHIKHHQLMLNRDKLIFSTLTNQGSVTTTQNPHRLDIYVFGFENLNEHFCLDQEEIGLIKQFVLKNTNPAKSPNLQAIFDALNRVKVTKILKPIFDYEIFGRNSENDAKVDVFVDRTLAAFKVKTSIVYLHGVESTPGINISEEIRNLIGDDLSTIRVFQVEEYLDQNPLIPSMSFYYTNSAYVGFVKLANLFR